MSDLPSIVRLTIEDLGDDATPVEDYIEQLQQRNAELEAHVERLRFIADTEYADEDERIADIHGVLEETPQQSLNALKREVLMELGQTMVCGECTCDRYVEHYTNTNYPTEG